MILSALEKHCIFYFFPSALTTELMSKLTELHGTGANIGVPINQTHTCYTAEQRARFDKVFQSYVDRGLEYEMTQYFSGNLKVDEFGIEIFAQPMVHWCPLPIISVSDTALFEHDEPWGLTTAGDIALNPLLRSMITNETHGLKLIHENILARLDIYRLEHIHLPGAVREDKPVAVVDGADVPAVDMMQSDDGVILCSQRLAKVLKKFWQGYVEARFQPVICNGFSKDLAKEMTRRLAVPTVKSTIPTDIKDIEATLNVKFPKEYTDWLAAFPGDLPLGFLSPKGGNDSELLKVTRTEHDDAEPAMPDGVIPFYADGTGDYTCFSFERPASGETAKKFAVVDWSHEDGEIDEIGSSAELIDLLNDLSG